ncbi:MAG: hypothetical protein NTY01_10930, partial [Verrucomicrobia bacterium]|nr:hypothetical protein [Verrucomicrobiota bacterium]
MFDRDSYKKVTDDDTFQKLLACLWMNFHWIYIGCGSTTSDPNLGKLIQWGAEKFPKSSPSHFRLCLARDTAALLEEHQTHHKLYVLPYGDKHERLPAFLRNTCDAFRCSPFVRVEEQAQFFRVSTQDPHRVVWPARQEYVNGAVYRPTFLRQVVTGLQDAGFVWLRGRASHGKTTAALLLATASEQREPVYYLDLKNEKETDAGSAVGILRSLCRPGILFILDNVNRDESLARRLFEVWNESRRSSRMLLLGRSGPENTRSCLADLQLNAVKAELKLDDFAGVFHTVLHRLAPGRPIPDPPESALEKWQTDFDSDLVAFCVAVTACERKLRRSDWALPLEAANHHIQEKYLNPKRMGVREKGNVLKLAAFSGEELGLPKEAFGRNPFKAAVADGLVVEFSQKDGSNCRFELYEPGLGPLLLAATKDTFNPAAEVFRVCRRAPSVAVAFAERLEVSGQFQQARKLLQRLLSDHKAADWLLTQHLPWAVDTLKRILRQEAGTFEELDVWLAKKPEYFTLAIRTQPLNAVGQLLRFANGKLPEVSAQLDRVLRDPKQQTLLSDKLQKTPLYEFIQFLDVLSAVGKKDLAQRLMSQYAARQDPEKAIAQALQGSLHNLAYSLNGVKKHGGATFSELLWVNLNLPVLMDRALHKDRTRADSLHLIAEFLRIAKECRPMLAKAI